MCPHSRQQVSSAKRLYQIIINSRIQALNARSLPARAESIMNGRVRVRSSERIRSSKPKPSRRGIITSAQNQVERIGQDTLQSRLSVSDRFYFIPLLHWHAPDVVAHVSVVIDKLGFIEAPLARARSKTPRANRPNLYRRRFLSSQAQGVN